MTDMIQMENLFISGKVFLDDEEEKVLELLQTIQDIQVPSKLDSQLVNIDQDNPLNSAIILSDGLPEGPLVPQGSAELITVTVDNEEDVSVSVDLSADLSNMAATLFDALLPQYDVHITDFDLEYSYDVGFSELDIEVSSPVELDFTGVKYSSESYDVILQTETVQPWNQDDLSVGDPSEEEETADDAVTANVFGTEHFTVEESSSFIEERINAVEGSLQSFAQ